MTRILSIGLIILAFAAPALAQQAPPPDPAFMQKAIAALQSQRNIALDAAASAEARANILTEENAALKKQIADLAKPADQPPAK